jgi:hypothetical protein
MRPHISTVSVRSTRRRSLLPQSLIIIFIIVFVLVIIIIFVIILRSSGFALALCWRSWLLGRSTTLLLSVLSDFLYNAINQYLYNATIRHF